MLVSTSNGALQSYKDDQVEWTREESLSAIAVAEFVELPEAKTVLTHVDLDGESFITRLTRQLSDARVGTLSRESYVLEFTPFHLSRTSLLISSTSSNALLRDPMLLRRRQLHWT